MLQTSACICVCPSGVSFSHQSLCPRGLSPTQKEAMKTMTLKLKANCNIHLYLFSKETQTILWQTYTCVNARMGFLWHARPTLKCLCVLTQEVLRDPASASCRPLCCGLHINTEVPVVNNWTFFVSLSFPTFSTSQIYQAPLPPPLTR